MLNTSLLHILFTINTVKTISAAGDHKERKEIVLLLLCSLYLETGAPAEITHDCESCRG